MNEQDTRREEVKYKISFNGYPDKELWDSGYRVSRVGGLFGISLLKYTKIL